MAVNVNGAPLVFDAKVNLQGLQDDLNKAKGIVNTYAQQQTQGVQKQAAEIENIAKRAATAIGAYLSFSAATGFISDMARVRGEFQQLEQTFTTFLGSKAKADRLMADAVKLAATTPFELKDIANGAKQLLAYGTSSEKVIGTLKTLGDVAAGVGAPIQELTYLYGTLQSQGRAYTVDIRQFASRGIPIYKELAKVLGVSVKEVGALVEAGKVGFPQVEQAFKNMTAEGGMFFNLMEAQSKTLTGQLSNLRDSWDAMLNDLGRSNEGILSGGIGIAKKLIDNYEKVIDVIKVIAITYGTYRAALMLTTIASTSLNVATKGLTAMQILQAGASGLATRAMALLNRTMLANPAVAIATGVAALVSVFMLLRKETLQVKSAQDYLADAQRGYNQRLGETQRTISVYADKLKDANISEQERVNIYEKLKAIDPAIVQGLNAKTLSYDALKKNVDKYIDSLRKQYALEANEEAVKASIKREQELDQQLKREEERQKKREQIAKNQSRFNKSEGISFAENEEQRGTGNIKTLQQQLKLQKDVTSELAMQGVEQGKTEEGKQEAIKRTVQVIDDEIAAQKKLQSQHSTNSKEFQSYQRAINKLEDERRRITGEAAKGAKAVQAEENKINAILEQRKSILDAIKDAQRDAAQSGMVKEQSVLDKINEKYDGILQRVDEYNKKVADFNKKNKTSVQGIGLVEQNALADARATELRNARLKQDFELYKKSLADQADVFSQYEDLKKQIGVEKASEMFAEQSKGFTNYMDYLKGEASKFMFWSTIGGDDRAREEAGRKLLAVMKLVGDETKAQAERDRDTLISAYQNAETLAQKTGRINANYYKEKEALEKIFSGKELENMLANLELQKDAAIDAAKDEAFERTEIAKELNNELAELSRAQIRAQIKSIETILKAAKNLTPKLRAELEKELQDLKVSVNLPTDLREEKNLKERKKRLEDQLKTVDASSKKWKEISNTIAGINLKLDEMSKKRLKDVADKMAFVASSLSGIGDALKPINAELAKQVESLSNMASIGSDAMLAIAGDPQAAVRAVTNLIKSFAMVKQSAIDARNAVQGFNLAVANADIDINVQMRERLLLQAKSIELTLKSIDAQKAQLAASKQASQAEYNRLLEQIAKEEYIASQRTQKKRGSPLGGLIGIFAETRTEVINEMASLAGMGFDQLEKLFNSGQLSEKAKQLFEQLQKLKQEGVDIDQQLKELADQTAQIFTGTTMNGLTDAITQMFRDGKTSAQDFANFFEKSMGDAALSIFKNQAIQERMQAFYKEFAEAAQSDQVLTETEIETLRRTFTGSMEELTKLFDNMQKVTGLNLSQQNQSVNSLQGAIRAQLTEETGTILAGAFNGVRLSLIDLVRLATVKVGYLNAISINTGNTVNRLDNIERRFDQYETGQRKLHVKL